MKKIEFSKLILIVAYATGVVFTAIAGWVAIVGGDAGSFANIVLAIWGLVSTAVGFYYWKAKAENMIKIGKKIPKELMESLDAVKEFLG
jgi:hypothetical protein